MSATMETEKLSAYYGNAPVVTVPGRTYPVESYFLEDLVQMTEYTIDIDSPFGNKNSIITHGLNDDDSTMG